MGFADLHLHTTASDGMMSPAMLLNYVSVNTPLDVIAITDHNTMDGFNRALEFQQRPANDHLHAFEIIPGIEISSRDGHIIGLFVRNVIPRDLSAEETIAAIHEQGGLALAPHPFAWLPGMKEFGGVRYGIVNQAFDAVEVRNSTPTEFFNNWRTQFVNRRRAKCRAEYGGSDAHFLWAVGRTSTHYPGRGVTDLRRALSERTTCAHGVTWGPLSLANYYRDRARWKGFCLQHKVQLHDL
jgi:predicted metal-dependent phosphoesterase TrpH